LEKELVKIVGRSKDPGRPLLYGSSEKFMEHFGLSSLQDLPKLKEIVSEENQIGHHEEDIQNE
jgi:segregation and condensation protein B